MSGRVPLFRPEPSPAYIANGAPISSGRQWLPMAHLANWLNGSPAMLVPACTIDRTIASGATGVFHFRVLTRAMSIERVWVLMLRSTTAAGATATIKAPTSTGTAYVAPVSSGRAFARPVIYREILSAKARDLTDLTIEVTAADGDIEIDSISCSDLARPLLNQDSTDLGVNIESTRVRERIYDSAGGYDSIPGVIRAMVNADCRRVGIYHWSAPTSSAITTTGAYSDILDLGVPVLAPLYDIAQVAGGTGEVYWSAYAKVSSGSGDVKLVTSHSGVSDSVNVTSTSFAWTAERAISIDCEDMTTADGLRAATFDEIMPSFRANGGVTLSLAAISVWSKAI